jgi:RimJ/RimL family protein N-acetyltransferase
MPCPYWPFFDLRIRSGRLELRIPTDDDLVQLAQLAARGIHDPATMPFAVPWTDKAPDEFERGFLQHHWGLRAALRPDDWHLEFAVRADGQLAGVQGIRAQSFAAQRTVTSGSWLGRGFQRQGIGRAMRVAILHLAFAGLGAEVAISEAFADNLASERISLSLGYRCDGADTQAPRGIPKEHRRFRLDRATWETTTHPPVVLAGLEPCLPLLCALP